MTSSSPVEDVDADKLAVRLGGQSRVRFSKDGKEREIDAVSNDFVAQAKPANFTLNKKFRKQAQGTFMRAIVTGRRPYFHFQGPPHPDVIKALHRYGKEYGVEPVIDTRPL